MERDILDILDLWRKLDHVVSTDHFYKTIVLPAKHNKLLCLRDEDGILAAYLTWANATHTEASLMKVNAFEFDDVFYAREPEDAETLWMVEAGGLTSEYVGEIGRRAMAIGRSMGYESVHWTRFRPDGSVKLGSMKLYEVDDDYKR